MGDWAPRRTRELLLEEFEAELAESPDDTEARFNRCCLLAELGRREEAKAAYLELLTRDANHFGALINLGNLVHGMGFRSAAIALYERAAAVEPDNPKAHVNLANLLMEKSDFGGAQSHYEQALRIDPGHGEANRGMAYLLTQQRDEERAAIFRQRAFKGRPLLKFGYCGEEEPIRLLLLVSALGGGIPMRHHFDERIFESTALFVEFFDPSIELPEHHVIINTMGDADLCAPALILARGITCKSPAPVINDPARVLCTGRVENAQRLSRISGVVAPKMIHLSRKVLGEPGLAELLAREGFEFPLLLRAPGFHTGRHFELVADAGSLSRESARMPGDERMVIEYLDARDSDGKIGKYRVMMIDRVLYPLHLAISREWKIHYFTAEMADHPEHRARDAAFLQDMPATLGPVAMRALDEICKTLALDYCGIDFSLSPAGEVILFEANATMVVHEPDRDPRWDYRRPAVRRILDAVRHMVTSRRSETR